MPQTCEKLDPPCVPATAPRARLSAPAADGTATAETSAPVLLIGSRRDCGLVLVHPDLSKTHCAIINTGRVLLVRDLLSRSGTFVNEQLTATAVLRPGETLRVGPVAIAVEFLAGPSAAEADLEFPTPLIFETGGREVAITRNGSVIGRRNSADLMLDTPDVSLAHALVCLVAGRPAICDLGSRSGTLVNGQRTDLAWLADGDQVEIGGERLTVRWRGSAAGEPAAEAAPVPLARPVAPAASGPVAPVTVAAEMGELERTIAGVQAQIAAACARIEQRTAQLEQRELELQRRHAEWEPRIAAATAAEAALQQREQAARELHESAQNALARAQEDQRLLEQGRAELAGAQAELERARAELSEQRAALDQDRARLDADRAALAGAQGELEQARGALREQQAAAEAAAQAARRRAEELQAQEEQQRQGAAALESDRQALAAERAAFAADQAAQTEAARQAQEQLEALGARAAELEQRERELADQVQALAAREQRQSETTRRIEDFKSALQRAGEMFAAVAGGETPEPEEPGSQSDGPGARGSSSPAAPGRAEAEALADGLPAPMVAQPIFDGAAGQPPTDWPAELRERFLVLRRVSAKSNEDLLAQVWAERKKVLRLRPAPPPKKRRFPWSA